MNEMNQDQERRSDEEEPVPAEAKAHDVHLQDSEHARLENQLQRAMADLANLRRRQTREVAEARQRAIEALALELLPVLDNFQLALGATQARPEAEDAGSIVEGLKMVRSMLEGVLERHGVSAIEAEGETFDPNMHEAVGLDHDSEVEPGKITGVAQRGYKIHDRVLRPSRVIVRSDTSNQRDNPEV